MKKTKKELLKEEIALFYKNEKAIYDVLALYEFMINTNYNFDYSIIGVLLASEVIKDLEDPEVDIPLKGNKLTDLLEYIDNYRKMIRKNYKNEDGCQEELDTFYGTEYKESACLYQFKVNSGYGTVANKNKSDKPFNLILDLACSSPDFAATLLASKIPFEKRYNMYKELLLRIPENAIDLIYNARNVGVNEEKIEDIEKELVQKVIDDEDFKRELALNLISKEKYRTMLNLNEKFNLNNIEWTSNELDWLKEGYKVSTVALIVKKTKRLCSFKELYESENYLSVKSEIRDINDILIFKSLPLESIPEFIKLSNFIPTKDKMHILGQCIYRVLDEQEGIHRKDSYKKEVDRYRHDIYDAIIHKAANKEEYKKLVQLANIFMEDSDYSNKLKALYQELYLENEIYRQKELSRGYLTQVLKNLDDSLNEQVPGKTIIKNIRFVKPKNND